MIFYFTGTGNSAYVARKIASITQDSLCSINDKLKKKDTSDVDAGDRIIFVTPVYSWRIPKVVESWIRKTHFKGNPSVYFVITCGGSIGNALKYAQKLCELKHFQYMGTAEIQMPENYIALFSAADKEEARKIIQKAEPTVLKLAEDIRCGRHLTDKPAGIIDHITSGPVNPLFYALFVHAHKFWATDKCTGCGLCQKNCPLNNIKITDGKPVWGKYCTHCMACICKCPVQAIEYGKNSARKNRYECPT